jgi:hypothetical protein
MNTTDTASLADLHDIVVPPAASVWPPAPGWFVIGAIVVVLAVAGLVMGVIRRHRRAYRRAALSELESVAAKDGRTVGQIAELLKRTALAVYPREDVAALTGEHWVAWLETTGGVTATQPVRDALSTGVHGGGPVGDPDALRQFAASWIQRHRVSGTSAGSR